MGTSQIILSSNQPKTFDLYRSLHFVAYQFALLFYLLVSRTPK